MTRPVDNARVAALAVAALTLGGAVIRWIVAGQDLFADELATYWIATTFDLPGVVDTVSSTAEITPPLGFMLAWLGAQIDHSPELLRMSALIAGIGTIPLVYAVGVRTAGRAAGVAAAAFVTVGPFMIFYSAEARGYGVMMAMVLLSTLAMLRALDGGGKPWWAAYAAFVALAAYTHYTSVFVLAGQVAWCFFARPDARRALLVATALAALAYVPWLPSLKGDLDSPTTDLLGQLTPFDLDSIRLYLGHWLVGFPFGNVAGLRDLPGLAGLVLIGAGVCAGAYGLWSVRDRLRAWFAAQDDRIVLLVLLALATPVGAALASVVGTNVFSTRNLAASWPYVALAVAALVTVGMNTAQRLAGALLIACGLGIGAAKMTTADYARPAYSDVAAAVRADAPAALVDAASLTPGPLSNFDTEAADPGVPVFRLVLPEQKTEPFAVPYRLADPADLARRAAAEADGGPITIVTAANRGKTAGASAPTARVAAFVDALPPRYEVTDTRVFPGFLDLEAVTLEPR